MSRSYIILDCPTFRLESWGNGSAYCLTNKVEQMDIHLAHGDEANLFREDMDTLIDGRPHMSFEDIAAYLWDQCGYGDAAMPVSPFAHSLMVA